MKKNIASFVFVLAFVMASALPFSAGAQQPIPDIKIPTPVTTQFQSSGQGTFNLGTPSGPSAPAARSVANPDDSVMGGIPNPLKGVDSISDLIYKVINIVLDLSYVVIAFFLLLAGFKFITAQGSDTKLKEAKSTFFNTIIGAAIIIGAQVIVGILQSVFNSLQG